MAQYSLVDRFPEWQREFEHLAQEDDAFREICEDYQSVLDTLAELEQSVTNETRLLNDCRDLQQALTTEALQVLQRYFPQPDTAIREGRRE